MICLGEIFRDGMILQANKQVRVFGTGSGTVTVRFLGEQKKTVSDGKWVLTFSAHPYGGPYSMEIEADGKITVIQDIMIGEVILFAGQSNIEFHMAEGDVPESEYTEDDLLRIFVCECIEEGEETLSPADGWVRAKKDNIAYWSAVAYLTGRKVRASCSFAVGVVACSQGQSVIQSWIDESILVGSELDLPDEQLNKSSKHPTYAQWNAPGKLYHYMLMRLIPFVFGNAVWYQGESNSSVYEGRIYDRLLVMMINNWRAVLDSPELPFIIVQISDYTENEGWKLIQQAQEKAVGEISGTKLVISADVCEKHEVHPKTKSLLAERIAKQLQF